VALDDWENEGRPVSWDDKWRDLYQSAAAEATVMLKAAAVDLLAE
jgi:hypothetical protein